MWQVSKYVSQQVSETNIFISSGALDDKPELEPASAKEGTPECVTKKTCDSPLYYKGDTFLGKQPLASTEDFGLDVYEPLFARPIDRWYEGKKSAIPNYHVRLTIKQKST